MDEICKKLTNTYNTNILDKYNPENDEEIPRYNMFSVKKQRTM